MPPIYLGSDLLSYKRKPNFLNPIRKRVGGDPFLGDVVLHLRFDGNFLDASDSPKTVTGVGVNTNITISDAQKKYGTHSCYFNGTNGSYLSVASSEFVIGTGDYCLESWVHWDGSKTGEIFAIQNSGWVPSLYVSLPNTVSAVSYSVSIPLSQWVHLAICRRQGILRLFVNGISAGNGALAHTNNYTSNTVFIGVGGGSVEFKGYVDSLRLTRQYRYWDNFNPETDTFLPYQ
jgi:hypothetical protein